MAPTLCELQRIPTSGARAVEAFRIDGRHLLAIPQLALDIPGTPAGMNGGDSNTEMLILERRDGAYASYRHRPRARRRGRRVLHHRRPSVPGRCLHPHRLRPLRLRHRVLGLRVDGRSVRAVPVVPDVRRQAVEALDARRPPLPRAGPGTRPAPVRGLQPQLRDLRVGRRAVRRLPDHPFAVGLQLAPVRDRRPHFVAHADHVTDSVLYRWNGARYVPHQSLLPSSGRAFAHFTDGDHYLVVAGLAQPPAVLRWDGERFVTHARLEGLGAREVRVVEKDGRLFLIRVNFILGTPADPETVADLAGLRVARRRVRDRRRVPDHRRHRCRGAHADGDIEFAVSNALSADVRFAAETVLYALSATARARTDDPRHPRVAGVRPVVPGLHRLPREHRRPAVRPRPSRPTPARR